MSHIQIENYSRSDLQQQNRRDLRDWLTANKDFLTGRVLDYGCGPLMQYRDLVSGEYVPYDPFREGTPREYGGTFDAVMCTQVVQFTPASLPDVDPRETLMTIRSVLNPGGYLVLTWSCNWYEIEDDDTWRVTEKGMRRFLAGAGFEILKLEPITTLQFPGWVMNCVYGAVARA